MYDIWFVETESNAIFRESGERTELDMYDRYCNRNDSYAISFETFIET